MAQIILNIAASCWQFNILSTCGSIFRP